MCREIKVKQLSLIAVYVDDILIAAKTDKRIAEVKATIANHLEVKDMVTYIIS